MSKKIKTRLYHTGSNYTGLVQDKETWNALKAGAISWDERQRRMLTQYTIPAEVYWDLFEKDRSNGFEAKCCNHCMPSSEHDFLTLNDTVEYSGIEIALNDQGMLRIRVYDKGNLETQDIVNITYCPFCGRRFKNGTD